MLSPPPLSFLWYTPLSKTSFLPVFRAVLLQFSGNKSLSLKTALSLILPCSWFSFFIFFKEHLKTVSFINQKKTANILVFNKWMYIVLTMMKVLPSDIYHSIRTFSFLYSFFLNLLFCCFMFAWFFLFFMHSSSFMPLLFFRTFYCSKEQDEWKMEDDLHLFTYFF